LIHSPFQSLTEANLALNLKFCSEKCRFRPLPALPRRPDFGMVRADLGQRLMGFGAASIFAFVALAADGALVKTKSG
jgi:hypothetical protein